MAKRIIKAALLNGLIVGIATAVITMITVPLIGSYPIEAFSKIQRKTSRIFY